MRVGIEFPTIPAWKLELARSPGYFGERLLSWVRHSSRTDNCKTLASEVSAPQSRWKRITSP